MLVNEKFSFELFSRSLRTCCYFLLILQKFQMQTKLAGALLWNRHKTLRAPWKWTHVKQITSQDELKSNTYSTSAHPGPYSEILNCFTRSRLVNSRFNHSYSVCNNYLINSFPRRTTNLSRCISSSSGQRGKGNCSKCKLRHQQHHLHWRVNSYQINANQPEITEKIELSFSLQEVWNQSEWCWSWQMT